MTHLFEEPAPIGELLRWRAVELSQSWRAPKARGRSYGICLQYPLYARERAGGYLWAPLRDELHDRFVTHHLFELEGFSGGPPLAPQSRRAMIEERIGLAVSRPIEAFLNVAALRPGDVIFHCDFESDGRNPDSGWHIVAVSTTQGGPVQCPDPRGPDRELRDGLLVATAYRDLQRPIKFAALPMAALRAEPDPIEQSGEIQFGYLHALSNSLGEDLLASFPELQEAHR